ncbi:hypothetical protein PHYBLDRAFT_147231 [Phycomyces blakesleeanus NRRL 1555(-)]|uniref:Uncharacterized protein n=1 Tax=Phycomyces blakesleeanus (strain ATCC 8743b / DSM 1359 / FGSC 10004 / NBRC 33097 / NRRL 1555) TaxID=763407 RepID=A0A163A6U0_PHYB8|nr:hypothetical protein PHYBLDRAFT_147231 [Phycomyces blakesleeanus NRRL 1555(-)]OAD71471.1 hypothetical protein PHYBLDRAFT_147231 [Phycomyces blakesleeanus NRRL 1555(-)]|eukprot:XP_018289511.1 hypothetical protein PHYBLDRAFT_147231 [Phycomyces blakesleeanus NRRL 1555(-)]
MPSTQANCLFLHYGAPLKRSNAKIWKTGRPFRATKESRPIEDNCLLPKEVQSLAEMVAHYHSR